MRLDEAKQILNNAGCLVEAKETVIDLSKMKNVVSRIERQMTIFERIGTMVEFFLNLHFENLGTVKIYANNDADDKAIFELIIRAVKKNIELHFSTMRGSEKELWVEYSINGKEGGEECKYYPDSYENLLMKKDSYINVINDLFNDIFA